RAERQRREWGPRRRHPRLRGQRARNRVSARNQRSVDIARVRAWTRRRSIRIARGDARVALDTVRGSARRPLRCYSRRLAAPRAGGPRRARREIGRASWREGAEWEGGVWG